MTAASLHDFLREHRGQARHAHREQHVANARGEDIRRRVAFGRILQQHEDAGTKHQRGESDPLQKAVRSAKDPPAQQRAEWQVDVADDRVLHSADPSAVGHDGKGLAQRKTCSHREAAQYLLPGQGSAQASLALRDHGDKQANHNGSAELGKGDGLGHDGRAVDELIVHNSPRRVEENEDAHTCQLNQDAHLGGDPRHELRVP
mmetsp:Transcript_99163/g.236608  ORF Transcript_99163/g.236608 Transcript_99163/m.236608 type:complete len:203 (-) Transcript_99163:825-1433(-)